MEKITLEDLQKALKFSWSAETSVDPDNWTPENPAWGQCAITALIVQYYFGGNLLRSRVDKFGSHYWNKLPNGEEQDLTRSQFPEGVAIPFGEKRTRDCVLSFQSTIKRYELLKQRVEDFLKNKGGKE